MKEQTRGPLTPYETAAIAAGVPASGDAAIDAILTQALRFKTAASILEAVISNGGVSFDSNNRQSEVDYAVVYADLLIAKFRKK